MKISTSNIDLSSVRTFSEKNQVKIEKEVRFSNLFDRMRINTKPNELPTSGLKSQWYDLQSLNGQLVFNPSSQFLNELGKMRQLFDEIVSRVNRRGLTGCTMHKVDIGRVNINPFQQSRIDRIEYTQIEQRTYTHHEQENTLFLVTV